MKKSYLGQNEQTNVSYLYKQDEQILHLSHFCEYKLNA